MRVEVNEQQSRHGRPPVPAHSEPSGVSANRLVSRMVCTHPSAARHPFVLPATADSIGKALSSDVTSTDAVLYRFNHGCSAVVALSFGLMIRLRILGELYSKSLQPTSLIVPALCAAAEAQKTGKRILLDVAIAFGIG